jgi:arylsulfatase A-like enzyme
VLGEAEPSGDKVPDHYPIASGPLKSVYRDGFWYIKQLGNGKEELFDFDRDVREERNLAGQAQYQQYLERCRQALETLQRAE